MLLESAGWSGVHRLVDDCLRPPKGDRRRPLPIVELWAPDRYVGPSELLDHLEKRFRDGRPNVRRKRGELDRRRPHEVAALLAFQLSCSFEEFGRLKFPRLLLGLAAIRGTAVDREMPDRWPLAGLLREIAPDLLNFLGAAPGTRFVLGLAVKGLLAFAQTVRLPIRRGLRWYRDGLSESEHFADPIDALSRLKEYEDSQQTKKVDEVLCRAFLADLRDGYSKWSLRLYKRDENCLALLDDGDSEAIRRFLIVLAKQRQGWDPLLIVAARSTCAPAAGHRWEFRSAVDATYQDWRSNRAVKERWAAFYPLSLDGLMRD